MNIDITRVFNSIAPMDYSASCAEIGQNACQDTWNAAIEDSKDYFILDSDDKRDAFRSFVQSSGGWDASEIAAWSDIELNSLCLQWISGDMRESGLHADMTNEEWADYQDQCGNGNVSGRIFGGPLSSDGKVYFYIGC